MDIIECLDDEDDGVKVKFEGRGEFDISELTFSVYDVIITIYPDGIKKLRRMLELIDLNDLVKE